MDFSDFGLLIARYNTALPTLVDGAFSQLQVDVNGRLLVQANVTVLIDFLGLNGASDSANILIAGTEDGTGAGAAHAIKVESDGRIIVSGAVIVSATNLDIRDLVFASDKVDVSGSAVTAVVTATDLDIRDLAFASDKVDVSGSAVTAVVTATDLDIRNLSHTQDSVKIGDGTDFLAVNTDGSINTNSTQGYAGVEAYATTDAEAAAGDGVVTITALATPWIDVASIAVGAGQFLHIYGMDFSCDQNCQARLITDDGTDVKVEKVGLNTSSMATMPMYWGDAGRIEIAGSSTMNVKLQIKKRQAVGGNAIGGGSIHARLV